MRILLLCLLVASIYRDLQAQKPLGFLLTGKDITFSYYPYDIGPYFMGNIAVFIPFKDIEPYLQPAFKKLIGQ